MSEELEDMATAIFNNQVPPVWVKKGFLSLKPLASWIDDCNLRIDFLNRWIKGGTPKVYWISGFFFPQAFFTGTVQNYARLKTIAVDKLSNGFEYPDDITYEDVKEKPEYGCLCYGLYIEGCRWDYDKHLLTDSSPKKLFTDMPMMKLIPECERAVPTDGIYRCPVYKVLSRTGTLSTTGHSTNFVMWIELPSDREQRIWIKAGVACFLALRY